MYEAFFGFREKPFNLTPDPKFLYLSAKHNEAFAHLEFGLVQRGGFMVVTGEVGTGKTTLCRYFLDRLDQSTVSAFILYPALGVTELLSSINADLGVETEGHTQKELIDALHAFLLESRLAGKNIVLVIDEAQNLSRDVLEQVRLISNLETDTEKLIQIVLIGQSELNELLGQNDLRQLSQRVTTRYHLTPLSRAEITQYVRHRLAVAGGISKVDFTPGAIRTIHRFSKGIPRLINLVCDRSLLAGYVLEQHEIDRKIVRRAIKELNVRQERPWYRRLGWGLTSLAAFTLLALTAMSAGRSGNSSEGLSSWSWPSRSLFAKESEPPSDLPPLPTPSRKDVTDQFELRVLTLSEDLSRRAASAVLLEQWGVHLGGGVAALSMLEDMPSLADRAALQYSEIQTNLEQLRILNVPVVVELFHPSRNKRFYAALTQLDGDSADVYFGPGDFFRVPLDVLESFWTGQARMFWRDFEQLESADIPSRLAWARGRLEALGFLPSATDSDIPQVEAAVKALQMKAFLEPTGEIGHQTRMALYSLSGGYEMPQLVKP